MKKLLYTLTITGMLAIVGCAKQESEAPATSAPDDVTDSAMTSEPAPSEAEIAAEEKAEQIFEEVKSNPLTGTRWRLIEYQSMDEQGSTQPEDPTKYTMELNVDGTVNMVLDCNRAHGTWTTEPGEYGDSGSFEFGPLAMTKAMCPQPSMDQIIASNSESVATFLLKEGNLYLSLKADGGIIAWEPNIDQDTPVEP